MELDAASHTGVDDIREILDGVRYKPTNARYKIYIIDEVHMLSKSAFNALLKTLEEPPSHVKFIFATTEIRKVPVTILSRCQRFDLQRISIEDLTGLFKKILGNENLLLTKRRCISLPKRQMVRRVTANLCWIRRFRLAVAKFALTLSKT